MTSIAISFEIITRDFSEGPRARGKADALHANVGIPCPLQKWGDAGCRGEFILRNVWLAVESKYFGYQENNFIVFDVQQIRERTSHGTFPWVCPECGIAFWMTDKICGEIQQGAYNFLRSKKIAVSGDAC